MATDNVLTEFTAIHTYLRSCLDIIDDEKMLRQCYTDTFSRPVEEDALAAYAFNIPILALQENNQIVKDYMVDKFREYSSVLNTSPIFLYAPIGQGKTTYLLHLIKIKREDSSFQDLRDKVYFIYLPLTSEDADLSNAHSNIEKYLIKVYEDILEEHKDISEDFDTLKEVFPQHFSHFRRLRNNHPEDFRDFIINQSGFNEYVKEWIKWIKDNKSIKVCCVIDNIDQHFHIANNDKVFFRLFQFVISREMQLILPLRISNKGILNNNFFDSYHPIPISLSIPDFGHLILKRLTYIESHFKNELKSPIFKVGNKNLTTEDLFDKLHSIANIIMNNPEVKQALTELSNFNSRSYLRIIVNSFSSHSLFFHPLSGEQIDYSSRISAGKFYSLFLYSLMLRDADTYYEEGDKTPVINLFSNNLSNNWNSFIKYHMLYFINKHYDDVSVSFKQFTEDFTNIYRIDLNAIKNAMKTFIQKKCVAYKTSDNREHSNISQMVDEQDFYISISSRGRFHLKIVSEIEYYEVLAMPSLKSSISNTTKKSRAENLSKFLKRLKEEERSVKSILKDENTYEDYLLWTKEILPNIVAECNKVFINEKECFSGLCKMDYVENT